MEIRKFEDRESWEIARRGKITGSRVGDLSSASATKDQIKEVLDKYEIEYKKTGTKAELEAVMPPVVKKEVEALIPEKITYYELIAERLATRPDNEHPMIRGTRLEEEAMARFEDATKLKLNTDLVIWQDSENPDLAISPDGYVEGKKKITIAAEGKCLSSARHIEAFITQKIPKEYEDQGKWYFVLNPDLVSLFFCFYDPRMIVHDFFFIEIKRSDYPEGELEGMKQAMIAKLAKVEAQVAELVRGTDLEF